MRMVWAGAKPSLRLASCCRVDVVNGGGGLRRAGLASILATVKRRVLQRLLEGFGLGARTDIEALDLLAVGADETRLEGVVARGGERRHQRPIFPGDELLDFELAVADEAQRHRLHPAGGARARELAPQHRREGKADEVVECPAGEIRVDQGAVDAAGVLHRIEHRLLGDGVEHHPLDRLLPDGVLFFQHLEHVPGDRLALAVGVGGQDQLVGALHGPGNVVEALAGLVVDLPEHAEIVLGIDRSVLRREVTDMAERRQHLVAGAKVFVDRFCLGRRLDDNDIHENPIS